MDALTEDYAALLAQCTPLIDVRSPAEFARGAFPGAVNLPLLTDRERRQVGIRYRHDGQDAAFRLGEALVSGAAKEARLARWQALLRAHPQAVLYCWRGGTRSRIAQEWLTAAERPVTRVAGGYKALRRFCLATLAQPRRWIVLGGRAGTGKTEILRHVPAHIDLEGLANHRGSAFGALATPQPTPTAFENALAAQLVKRPLAATLAVEDESRTIGRLAIPAAMFSHMQQAPLMVVEAGREARINRIVAGYVFGAGASAARLGAALNKIQRRLGGERFRAVRQEMGRAFDADSAEAHRNWVGMLLDSYYDPMYDYQLRQKQERIVFRGEATAVREALLRAVADAQAEDPSAPQ